MSLSPELTEKKVAEYETFLNDVLREKLKAILLEREGLCQEILELEQLKTVIERLQEAELTKETIKTRVDLGCNFYVQANVTDAKYIFVKVGLGLFAQFTLEEATKFISRKVEFLNKKVEKTLKESSEVNAHIQLILQGLRELQNLNYTSEQQRRDIL
ncbi:protein UXT homolog [Caerostris extrusa]|uniref:Protein UXT homolog n=1 Tax=Caerostris extrusa TaxID=172846 RepID=A0AAV4NSF3_CAEEX|nr:protein UXT homolog [Caerostris extrusa]